MRETPLKPIDPQAEHVFAPAEVFELMPQIDEISFPIAFVNELTRAHSITDALDVVLHWLRGRFGADRASIAMVQQDGLLGIWALSGNGSVGPDKSIPSDQGRLGRSFKHSQLIISPDLVYCAEPDGKLLYKGGLRRTISAPLIYAGSCAGTINIGTKDVDGLGLREALDLQAFANWIAPMLILRDYANTAMREMLEERQKKKAALSESLAKSTFIASVSHEIRTPLNGILGMTQLLAREDLPIPQKDKVDVILDSAHSLLAILNDVLDLTKIEAGKLPITPVRNNLASTLNRTYRLWEDRAADKGLDLRLSLDEGLPAFLVYDAIRVQQCLSNLISNAIKFTETGHIEISARCAEGQEEADITIVVRDTGIGIEQSELEKLFEPFTQSDQSYTRRASGTGLGLSICRKLAVLMGGNVVARSAPGRGSAFTFSFRARMATGISAAGELSKTKEPDIDEAKSRLSGKSVLVVEDIATNRLVVEMFLGGFGMEIVHAENGLIALERLAERRFDIILLDMHMPVMDGPQTIGAIRAGPTEIRELPVIALTADAMTGDRERYLQLGIDAYLPKPIDSKELLSQMEHLLG